METLDGRTEDVMVMNVDALAQNKEGMGGVSQLLTPLFGEIHSVVYRMRE